MTSYEAYLSGISAAIILITGYSAAIGCFIRARKTKTPFLYWAGFFLLCMGSFYLGTVTSFVNLLIIEENIDTYLAAWLCYSVAPLGAAIAMYIGFTMIKPKLAKPIAIIYAISGVIFWYFLYFQSADSIDSDVIAADAIGGLIDLELLGVVNILTLIYLGSFAVILIPCFIWLAKVSSGLMRKRAIYQTIGYALFVICAFFDTRGIFGAEGMVFVRIVMASAYIFMFLGFTKTVGE